MNKCDNCKEKITTYQYYNDLWGECSSLLCEKCCKKKEAIRFGSTYYSRNWLHEHKNPHHGVEIIPREMNQDKIDEKTMEMLIDKAIEKEAERMKPIFDSLEALKNLKEPTLKEIKSKLEKPTGIKKPKRLNSYNIFQKHVREDFKEKFPHLTEKELQVLIAEKWKKVSKKEKEKYVSIGKQLYDESMKEFESNPKKEEEEEEE
jgi:hypothetical protein